MEKIKKLWTEQKGFWCICILSILFLSIYYGCHVAEINTVWELHDEYGFLANAEFLAHHNWPQLTTSYYGYGYSLALVPLFYLCGSGVQLIQGAVAVNIICILLIYIISLTLMCKMCDSIHKNVLAFLAAALCLYPYLAASTLKVFCECFLTMLTWLTWLLLFQAIKTKKRIYFILLGMVASYAFFTHTRAIALTVTVLGVLVILCVRKRIDFKSVLLCGATLFLFYSLGFLFKNYIIANVYTPFAENAADEATVVNVINLKYISDRIQWFFADFKFYVYAFLCKNVYLFVSSLGLSHLGIYAAIRKIFAAAKAKRSFSDSDWVEFGIVLSFLLMIAMVLVNGAGTLENVTYFYYGRYFEYMVCPLIFLGIRHCASEGLEAKQFLKWFAFWGVCALGSAMLSDYLKNTAVNLDTNRIAAFTFITKEVNQYPEVLEYLILCGSIGLFLVFLICRKEKNRLLVLIPLLLLFLGNDAAIIQQITYIHQRDSGDNYIADYIEAHVSEDEVYFVDTNYLYDKFYVRMQALLVDKKLRVIEVEDLEMIPAGTYFIGYNNETTEAKLGWAGETVMESRVFQLYRKL